MWFIVAMSALLSKQGDYYERRTASHIRRTPNPLSNRNERQSRPTNSRGLSCLQGYDLSANYGRYRCQPSHSSAMGGQIQSRRAERIDRQTQTRSATASAPASGIQTRAAYRGRAWPIRWRQRLYRTGYPADHREGVRRSVLHQCREVPPAPVGLFVSLSPAKAREVRPCRPRIF